MLVLSGGSKDDSTPTLMIRLITDMLVLDYQCKLPLNLVSIYSYLEIKFKR